jgi:NAD(P)-dependent dehydrogenase (short-subunit alcohol dehydrogenase family)
MTFLDGRVAVITGAGRGIGASIARLLAANGARVVVNDLGVALDGSGADSAPAKEVVDEIIAAGGDAIVDHSDVTDADAARSLIQTAVDTWGSIDVLVNAAGILRDRMIFNMSEQEWDDVIRVHLKGHFNTTKPAANFWREQRNPDAHYRLINFTSTSGLYGALGQPNYAAAKMGIRRLHLLLRQRPGPLRRDRQRDRPRRRHPDDRVGARGSPSRPDRQRRGALARQRRAAGGLPRRRRVGLAHRTGAGRQRLRRTPLQQSRADPHALGHLAVGRGAPRRAAGTGREARGRQEAVMKLVFSPEQDELRASVRRFLTAKSPTSAVRALMADPAGYDGAVWKQMASQLGLQGLAIPEKFGGSGFSFVELAVVLEEAGRALLVAPYFSSTGARRLRDPGQRRRGGRGRVPARHRRRQPDRDARLHRGQWTVGPRGAEPAGGARRATAGRSPAPSRTSSTATSPTCCWWRRGRRTG